MLTWLLKENLGEGFLPCLCYPVIVPSDRIACRLLHVVPWSPPHTHTEGSSYKEVYCADIMTTPCRTRDLTDLFTPDPKYC